RQRGVSQPTIAQLVSCVREFVLFNGKRHPRELGLPAVTRFLEHVVRTKKQPLPALERGADCGDGRCNRVKSLELLIRRKSDLARSSATLSGPVENGARSAALTQNPKPTRLAVSCRAWPRRLSQKKSGRQDGY